MTIHLTPAQAKSLLRKASPSIAVSESSLPPPVHKSRRNGISRPNLSEQEKQQCQTFIKIAKEAGWDAEVAKTHCPHRDASYWQSKPYNHVVIWRDREQYDWCVCELVEMSQEEMEQTLLAGETNRQKRRT